MQRYGKHSNREYRFVTLVVPFEFFVLKKSDPYKTWVFTLKHKSRLNGDQSGLTQIPFDVYLNRQETA